MTYDIVKELCGKWPIWKICVYTQLENNFGLY